MNRSRLGMLLSCAVVLATTSGVAVLADDDNSSGAGAAPQDKGPPAGGHRRGGGAGGHHDGLIKQVMTPDQSTKYDALNQEAAEARRPLIKQLKDLRDKQASAAKPDPDTDKKIADLQQQIRQNVKEARQKAEAMLSDEQKSKLKDLVAKARQARSQSAPDDGGGQAKAD